MDVLSALLFIIILALAAACTWLYSTSRHMRYSQKRFFYHSRAMTDKTDFPSLYSKPSIHLSLIIPAYNETKRLPAMLDDCLAYLSQRQDSFEFEVIIVDDGSSDSTTQVALEYTEKLSTNVVRVLTLEENRGKGGAVRQGVLSARGKYILFADADGATQFVDAFQRFEDAISQSSNDFLFVCASRSHLDSQTSRSYFRNTLMTGFHCLLVLAGVGRTVKDTQCGFKMFSRPLAIVLFSLLHVERWAFDVELLFLSEHYSASTPAGIEVREVPVHWVEIAGSKVTFYGVVWMAVDVALIRLRYLLGLWATPSLSELFSATYLENSY